MRILNKKGQINTLILVIAGLIIVAISLVVFTKMGDVLMRTAGEIWDNLFDIAKELVEKTIKNR